MSYLAQGINNGFALGAQMKKDRARMKFEEEQARAVRELRQKQLDFEASRHAEQIRQFDQSFGRQTNRDAIDDQRFATTHAYRVGRDGTSDSQFDQKLQQDIERLAMEKAEREAARLARERQQNFQERVYTETAGPGSPAFALPLMQGKAALENAETARIRTEQQADPFGFGGMPLGPNPSQFSRADEGRRVRGPDGRAYIISNGQPVPVQ